MRLSGTTSSPGLNSHEAGSATGDHIIWTTATGPSQTDTDLAGGFGIGLATVFRSIREALDLLAALAAPLA